MRHVFDSYGLEEIARHHRIGAGIFVPFVIERLGRQGRATEANLAIRLRDVGQAGRVLRRLRLTWSADSAPTRTVAVQERTVTEWAACGVACVVVRLYAGLQVRQVAADGDRFDYWVGDGKREFGLEVSGTTTEDVEVRHRAKVRQLLDNPYGVDGYVVIAGFATREVIFSFHRAEELVE